MLCKRWLLWEIMKTIHDGNILLWTICNHKNLVSIPSHLSCPLLPNVVNYSFWIILHLKIVYKYLGIFAFTLFLILHVLYSFPTNFLFWKTLNLWKIVRILIKFTFCTFHLVSPALNLFIYFLSTCFIYFLSTYLKCFMNYLWVSCRHHDTLPQVLQHYLLRTRTFSNKTIYIYLLRKFNMDPILLSNIQSNFSCLSFFNNVLYS